MTQQEKEREAIHNASVKHILPLVGNHVTAEDLNNALDKIADTAIEIIDELRKPSEDNKANMVSKEVMFDFVRWLREADRFNGGQSLKMAYEQFKNK